MRTIRLAGSGVLAALAMMIGGQQATAQEASGQFYGYPSKQAPVASGQGQPTGQVDKFGCYVVPCSPVPTCHAQINVPPIQPVPSCQTGFVIWNELPPSGERWVTIYRNHYVPIIIRNKETPVVPVNIHVKWREIHYLCDCPPGTSQCPHIPAGSPQGLVSPQAANDATPGTEPAAELAQAGRKPAAEAGEAKPAAPAAAEAPKAPAPTVDNTPAKRWVWLRKQGAYGFGYQRQDGLWVIDQGSLRPTLPIAETGRPAQPTTVAVSTGS